MNEKKKRLMTDEKVPPAGLVRMIMGFRNFLEKLRRNLVPPPIALLEMITGYWYTQAIYVAAKLGIADQLKNGPKNIDELAKATGAHAPSLYRLMRALASVNIFAEDKNGHFKLTPMAKALQSEVPDSMRAMAIMNGDDWYWRPWGELLHSVKTGNSAFKKTHRMGFFEYTEQNSEAGAVFNEAMTAFTAQSAVEVNAVYKFSGVNTLVDVGGGQGILIAGILKKHPHMRGINFDLPSVIEGAKALIEAQGLSSRCHLIGGDFFESAPSGGDAYILKNVIHDWDDEHAAKILKNCHSVMPQNGKLLLVELVIPEGNKPFFGKFLDLDMMVMGGARERTESEYRKLFAAAGFKLTRIISMTSPESVIESIRI